MIKSKKQMLLVISVFVVLLMLTTITYAFFNYTRTGVANSIRVGRIYFNTRQTDTISLTNVFPIKASEATGENPNYDSVVIEIEGDTDYADGIEYLVSAVDANIYTSTGQAIPISLDITVDDLGTSNTNYFTTRENTNTSIYKKIVGDTLVGDQMLLVGFIAPNNPTGTADGIDGSITIKAYLDENKILISDTYDGTQSDNMGTPNSMAQGKTVLTTTEWNALQTNGVSFKVKVEANEGIWVNGSLEEIMRKSAVMDNTTSTYVSASTGIDFGAISSDTNGKGVYMRAGTENDAYPILYYRGEVEDNNVLFNNNCWKAVRTTDTGGVKLIYNGELSYNKRILETNDYGELITNTGNYIFDSTNNSWNNTFQETRSYENPLEMSFKLPVGEYLYQIHVTPSTEEDSWSELDIYINNVFIGYSYGNTEEIQYVPGVFNITSSSDIISFQIYGNNNTSVNPSNISIMLYMQDESLGFGCNNMGTSTGITVDNINLFKFNIGKESPAYNGYMYGDVYTYSSGVVSGAYYDSTFIWDGENYKLTDKATTTKSNDRHYSCGETSKTAICASLRYYYYNKYYITLTGGDGVEEALVKMQTNTNDSNAKDKIETWYASNMNTVTNKLEDTIWCNDRSFGDGNNNGWIANGGDLTTFLYYGARGRSNSAQNTSTVKNQPSLACTNKNDAFTWKNSAGNGALDYPVGMITEDEMVLAGGLSGSKNGNFYLKSGATYWTLSPYSFYSYYAGGFNLYGSGELYYYTVDSAYSLRPSVSLKPGTPIVSGSGTALDPYVIN